MGFGTVATSATLGGTAGTAASAGTLAPAIGARGTPARPLTSASHLSEPGSTRLGAVGPTGLPKIQLMPTRIRLMPIVAMIVPVTTGGKKRSIRLTSGAIAIATKPAPITAPKIRPAPSVPGWLAAIATIGATDANVTPIITGSLMPNHWVAPSDWIRVTRPQQNRSAEISIATWSGVSLSARPTISGTATAPAYMTRTCCRPRATRRGVGSLSSTALADGRVEGAVGRLIVEG